MLNPTKILSCVLKCLKGDRSQKSFLVWLGGISWICKSENQLGLADCQVDVHRRSLHLCCHQSSSVDHPKHCCWNVCFVFLLLSCHKCTESLSDLLILTNTFWQFWFFLQKWNYFDNFSFYQKMSKETRFGQCFDKLYNFFTMLTIVYILDIFFLQLGYFWKLDNSKLGSTQ